MSLCLSVDDDVIKWSLGHATAKDCVLFTDDNRRNNLPWVLVVHEALEALEGQ